MGTMLAAIRRSVNLSHLHCYVAVDICALIKHTSAGFSEIRWPSEMRRNLVVRSC